MPRYRLLITHAPPTDARKVVAVMRGLPPWIDAPAIVRLLQVEGGAGQLFDAIEIGHSDSAGELTKVRRHLDKFGIRTELATERGVGAWLSWVGRVVSEKLPEIPIASEAGLRFVIGAARGWRVARLVLAVFVVFVPGLVLLRQLKGGHRAEPATYVTTAPSLSAADFEQDPGGALGGGDEPDDPLEGEGPRKAPVAVVVPITAEEDPDEPLGDEPDEDPRASDLTGAAAASAALARDGVFGASAAPDDAAVAQQIAMTQHLEALVGAALVEDAGVDTVDDALSDADAAIELAAARPSVPTAPTAAPPAPTKSSVASAMSSAEIASAIAGVLLGVAAACAALAIFGARFGAASAPRPGRRRALAIASVATAILGSTAAAGATRFVPRVAPSFVVGPVAPPRARAPAASAPVATSAPRAAVASAPIPIPSASVATIASSPSPSPSPSPSSSSAPRAPSTSASASIAPPSPSVVVVASVIPSSVASEVPAPAPSVAEVPAPPTPRRRASELPVADAPEAPRVADNGPFVASGAGFVVGLVGALVALLALQRWGAG